MLVVAVHLALLCAIGQSQTFDVARDFSPTTNPNGPWSYGYCTGLGRPLILYTGTDVFCALNRWLDVAYQNAYHNPTASTITCSTAQVPAGGFGLHPGPNGEYSVARFTAPFTGVFHVTGSFFGEDNGGGTAGVFTTTDVHILTNGITLFDGEVTGFGLGTGPSFAIQVQMTAGENLDFSVGYGTDSTFYNDSTGLSAEIVAEQVPNLLYYQGRLPGQNGSTMASYGMQFRLWDSATSSAASDLIWADQHDFVLVDASGVFTVFLGSGSAPAASLAKVNDLRFAFTETNRYLGLTIISSNGIPITAPAEIVPRQQLLSIPYSLVSRGGYPPGAIVAVGNTNVPLGWKACEGQTLSSLAYPALFAAIGTRWGSGTPGSTNDFSLPDLRGVFLRGWNHGQGRDPDASSRSGGGDHVGSYEDDAFAMHNHVVSDPGHRHNIRYNDANAGDGQFNDVAVTYFGGPAMAGSYLSESAQCNITISSTGASSETRPKNVALMYIIKY